MLKIDYNFHFVKNWLVSEIFRMDQHLDPLYRTDCSNTYHKFYIEGRCCNIKIDFNFHFVKNWLVSERFRIDQDVDPLW